MLVLTLVLMFGVNVTIEINVFFQVPMRMLTLTSTTSTLPLGMNRPLTAKSPQPEETLSIGTDKLLQKTLIQKISINHFCRDTMNFKGISSGKWHCELAHQRSRVKLDGATIRSVDSNMTLHRKTHLCGDCCLFGSKF